jgi:hypothetical protein
MPRLGEAERWGGSTAWNVILPAGALDPAARPFFSEQMIRVQQPNLLARSWDLLCQFDIQGYTAGPGGNEIALFALEVTTGAGQSTALGAFVLATQNPGRQVDGEFAHAGLAQNHPQGITQASFCIPSVAMAVRGMLIGAAGAGNPATPLSIALTVIVSPRALY